MSIADQVRKTFQRLPHGSIVASVDLHRLSEDNKQVDKAVSRIYQQEGMKKLRNGLYYKPSNSRYFGALPPKADAIINAIKKQYQARIVPAGPLAAYELGFTGMPPEERLYDSDKRIGTIRLDNDVLRFRPVVGKKLTAASLDVIKVLNALAYFFKEHSQLSYSQEQFTKRQLGRYSQQQIRLGLSARPQWLRDRIETILQTNTEVRYITGISALNIPYKGRVGDWHQIGMLVSHKFQIAGENYYSAPGITSEELFDCRDFLDKHGIKLETNLCAKPERAVKDLLYSNIIVKNRYPSFFMKDQYLLPLSDKALRRCISELRPLANAQQLKHLDQWQAENGIH